MEIKGSAVKSIREYVKERHTHRFNEWIESLPEKSKEIFTSPIEATKWYPIDSAAIIPSQEIGALIFNSAEEGAWELGRYSAGMALHGIYKVFVRVLNPAYLIQRAGRILSTFYRPSKIEVIEKSSKSVILHITEFDAPHVIIEKRHHHPACAQGQQSANGSTFNTRSPASTTQLHPIIVRKESARIPFRFKTL